MKIQSVVINGEEHELVSSVNGKTGDIEIDESNTKTFFLKSSNDLETAQAAVDWLATGGNSIIQYNDESYIISDNTIWETQAD